MTKNPFFRAEAQLCKLETELPKSGDWLFELKYDGYRILAFAEDGKVALLSRNGNDYTKQFQTVADSLATLSGGRAFIVDGEVIVTGKDGRSDFNALQNYTRSPKGKSLSYIVFDLLAFNGTDIRGEPLVLRKEKLKKLLENTPKNLRFCEHTEGMTKENLEAVCEGGYEGIVAKRADSVYSGTRNGDWIKLKCAAGQEFVICGFARNSGGRGGLSSVLLGVFEDGGLVYAGRAGTGFSEKDALKLAKKFEKKKTNEPPFAAVPKAKKGETVTWLAPEYIAEIRFAGWTDEGLVRQASFKGLRNDKESKEVMRETTRDSARQVITNPAKQMFKGISKQEVAEYYEVIGERMLPYIMNRILSLVRCPDGVGSPCFYKKHPKEAGKGLRVVKVSSSEGKAEEYYSVTDLSGILYEVQMNTLEFHVWGSSADNIDKPDVMVFDLDPDEGMTLAKVREGAEDLRSVLDGIGLTSFLKTSGGKGYHIVVPFSPSANWETFKNFSRKIAEFMEQKWPDKYTSNVRKANRKGKIFVDYLRNGKGATSIAPYSVRAREGAKVSMPISWEELHKISPDGITMAEAVKRLSAPDPWKDFWQTAEKQKLK